MTRDSRNENEYRSSAWSLLLVGGAGLLFVFLGIAGVIPLHVANPYLIYGVMMAFFLLFLVIGALSFKSANFFAQKVKAENTLLEALEKWCLENLHGDEIDAQLPKQKGDEIYFLRYDYLKEKLNKQFINLDQELVDQFIDERLYDMIFGDKK